jgi:hypothetical protein
MKTLEIQKAEEIIKWKHKKIDEFLIETLIKYFDIEIEVHQLGDEKIKLSERVVIKSFGEKIASQIITVETK